MRPNMSLALRAIPVVFFLGLVFGLTTTLSAAGKVTSSIRLAAEGSVEMDDGSFVDFIGKVHVVSQVFGDGNGGLVAVLRANISNMHGEGDGENGDITDWIGVGADQYPPDPTAPDPIRCAVPFDMIYLRPPSPILPPNPVFPPMVHLILVFDLDGNLLADQSSARIDGKTLPPDV